MPASSEPEPRMTEEKQHSMKSQVISAPTDAELDRLEAAIEKAGREPEHEEREPQHD